MDNLTSEEEWFNACLNWFRAGGRCKKVAKMTLQAQGFSFEGKRE